MPRGKSRTSLVFFIYFDRLSSIWLATAAGQTRLVSAFSASRRLCAMRLPSGIGSDGRSRREITVPHRASDPGEPP